MNLRKSLITSIAWIQIFSLTLATTPTFAEDTGTIPLPSPTLMGSCQNSCDLYHKDVEASLIANGCPADPNSSPSSSPESISNNGHVYKDQAECKLPSELVGPNSVSTATP
jgi:hypothetical protein